MKLIVLLITIIVIAGLLYLGTKFSQESFVQGSSIIPFIEANNMEFRGLNLLGTSGEGYFPSATIDYCRKVCDENEDCKAFSFYKDGNRCYMWESGGFIPGRPAFYSGAKLPPYAPFSFASDSLNY